MKIVINTDGGARGNPGPAAIGAVILLPGKVYHYKEKIGEGTNNFAEYQAVIFALKKLKHLIGKEKSKKAQVTIKADSSLLVNQMKGKFKIKDPNIKNLFIEVWNLKQDFGTVDFELIKREENKEADKLVNEALDEKNPPVKKDQRILFK